MREKYFFAKLKKKVPLKPRDVFFKIRETSFFEVCTKTPSYMVFSRAQWFSYSLCLEKYSSFHSRTDFYQKRVAAFFQKKSSLAK
jgi:hypothetical protein